MLKLENLYIYSRYNELIYYTHEILIKYPKYERLSLVSDIKNTTYEGMRCVIKVYKTGDKLKKLKYLHELDVNLKMLKVLIRLSYKREYINSSNYGAWSRHITYISNLMGGLIKQCRRP
jgi:hypothetical protein